MQPISNEDLAYYQEKYAQKKTTLTPSIFENAELCDIAFVSQNADKLNGDFTIEIPTMDVTWQMKSGRCWLFACLNILREEIAKNCHLKQFALSANYLSFYDKLEKANNVLEMVIENYDQDLDTRMMEYILDGFGDGGYWQMAKDLVNKYGVVPASAMAETYQSNHTERYLKLLKSLLRKDAKILREKCRQNEDVSELKQEMMAEIYQMNCLAFGEPVSRFHFEYRDDEGNYHSERNITPIEFYEKYVHIDLDDYITITNLPTDHKPLNTHYAFHYIGSMANRDIECLNLGIEEIEDLCISQLADDKPVWFDCDSGVYGHRQKGVWDPDSFCYDKIFGGIDFTMDKESRIMYKDSWGTHAMILTGVNLDENGEPDRWKIENSWGKDVGKNGYFVCSKKYFREYVYGAVILKQYLTDEQKALLDQDPIQLDPWLR